ncbi:hypothetical protein PCASD_04532 [Puccinia coronata f. sp. avenae]|uniref:Uncharacterized protein n=1 Tax=Puccinia coronata f. sp. avenae TaxID=200324 RepID=A0A2N5V549_9BASI|nr:hypothetical protein PCASD_04532 [Puccinia coronata f. sp. avenae]
MAGYCWGLDRLPGWPYETVSGTSGDPASDRETAMQAFVGAESRRGFMSRKQFSTGLRTGKDYLGRQIGHTLSLLSAGQPPAKKRLTRYIVDFSAQHKR